MDEAIERVMREEAMKEELPPDVTIGVCDVCGTGNIKVRLRSDGYFVCEDCDKRAKYQEGHSAHGGQPRDSTYDRRDWTEF